jgi:hypothetical protein
MEIRSWFWIHRYDYSHAVRNDRGVFISPSCQLKLFGTDITIGVKELFKVREKYPTRFGDDILPDVAYTPVDEMNMHDCLLIININVVKRLQEISQDDKEEEEKIAVVCSKFFDILRQYYTLMESNIISFGDKMKQLYGDLEYPEQPSILSLLSNYKLYSSR